MGTEEDNLLILDLRTNTKVLHNNMLSAQRLWCSVTLLVHQLYSASTGEAGKSLGSRPTLRWLLMPS